MKFFKLGFWIVIVCILINNAIAQNFGILTPSGEVIETGFDNRSLAMGKTTTTTSRSSSAIFSNPSVLATFANPQVQVGGKLLYGTTESEAESTSDLYESYELKYPIFPNRSYLAVAVPYQLPNSQLKLVFGAGYQRNEGTKRELETVSLEQEWSDEKGEFVDVRVTSIRNDRRRGYLSTLTPGIAINLQDKYFLGLTVNRTLGTIISTSEWRRADALTEVDEEQEQSAQFLRLGALAKVTPDLSIGLMYRSGFDWEFGETITKTYEDGELQTDRSQTDAELRMPSMWGLGAEYNVSPDFVVALELQSRPYTDLQWRRDFIQREVIDNSFNFAVGAEYLGAGFPLRFGAFRDVIPFVDQNDTAPVSFIGLTAGIGSAGDADFSWDVSALYGTWEQVNVIGQKYSENLIRVNISATYRFNTGFGTSSTR